jgi:hypothetical protein
MSTIYDKTDNYALNLYGDDDPADLRDGYNGSMRTIDDTLEKHLKRIEGVESRETHDEEVVKALIGDNTVDSAATAKVKWDKAGADAAAAMGEADDNKTILTALGVDTAAHATAAKSKWDKAGADAATALKAGKTNPVSYGADDTGVEACDDAIKKAIADSQAGITFTDGIYRIMEPIEFPYNTGHPFNITLSEGATIVAGARMDAMFKVGVVDRGGAEAKEGFKIAGGHFDAAHLADTAIFVSKNISRTTVTDIVIENATGNGLIIDANNANTSSNSIVSNVNVNSAVPSGALGETVGINFIGCDNILSDCFICNTCYGVKSGGLLQASNLHIFVDKIWENMGTTAIYGTEGVFNNIYIDSCKYGFDMTGNVQVSGLFVYNYYEAADRYVFKCVNNKLHAFNVQNAGYKSRYIINQGEDRVTNANEVGFLYEFGNVTPSYDPNGNDWLDFISGNGVLQTYYLTSMPAGARNTGVLLGYLTRQNQQVVGYVNPIISPARGYEFLFDGPISGDTIFTKADDENYGLLLGKDMAAPWNGNLTVAPLYLYHRKDRAYAVDVQLTFKEMHYLGFFAKPGRTLVDVSTIEKKNTSNTGEAL